MLKTMVASWWLFSNGIIDLLGKQCGLEYRVQLDATQKTKWTSLLLKTSTFIHSSFTIFSCFKKWTPKPKFFSFHARFLQFFNEPWISKLRGYFLEILHTNGCVNETGMDGHTQFLAQIYRFLRAFKTKTARFYSSNLHTFVCKRDKYGRSAERHATVLVRSSIFTRSTHRLVTFSLSSDLDLKKRKPL